MVHKMFSVVDLSFVHTEESSFLCSVAAAATDLFSFRIKMGTFIYNLIFNSFSGKSFLDSQLYIIIPTMELASYAAVPPFMAEIKEQLKSLLMKVKEETEKVGLKSTFRTSLVAQWLRVCLPTQGTWVRFLLREDSTCCRPAKPERRKNRARAQQ